MLFYSTEDRHEHYVRLAKTYNINIPLDALIELGFFTAPASTTHHLNTEGGLYRHSVNVATALGELTNRNHLQWQRPESPIIVGLFHDLCKCDQYVPTNNGLGCTVGEPPYKYNPNTLLTGHGIKSVAVLSQFMMLTPEEIACITYHMGAFTDKDEWSKYTNAIHKYPNVLWTHHADMIATHIMEVD